ncbi:MAG: Uma2 family endonuclease [Gemmatimonadales bacterium]
MPAPATPTPRRYSVEEVLAFPADGNRYEVVRGELLVTPSPRYDHQLVVGRLVFALRSFLAAMNLADSALTAPADITWGIPPRDAEDLVQPDIFVLHPDERVASWVNVARLALTVEVVSPSSTRADRVVKRRTYQQHRVETYWVVDPDAQLVEVWHPEDERPLIVTDTLTWRPTDSAPELAINLAELFAPPHAAK